ncbi:MAG: dTDP-4-dehydrorhamnose reductase [Desulfobacteraceae bacterium]|nr:dTDP-4-dehydrorhamnose reductase [Desulfobacteraceae bacterium]
MKLLIIGNKGQLGKDLTAKADLLCYEHVGVDLPDFDITDKKSIRKVMENYGPFDAAINAAAYTAVDDAEQNAKIAFAINQTGAANLASACTDYNLPLFHVSTDYVFDGKSMNPYRPCDPISPLGIYGQSKAAGEKAVRDVLPEHVIVRTSWLFGLYGNNFVKTMLALGKTHQTLKIVDDQAGCPTYAADLANVLLKAAYDVVQGNTRWGTYHYCNKTVLTWYAFARRIFTLAKAYTTLKVDSIFPILSKDYPQPAKRPQYSVLDCTSFCETFGVAQRSCDEALKEMLAALLG